MHNSEAFEEFEDGVAWAIAFAFGLRGREGREGTFLHCQISLDIAMGRDRALVTQSQGDDRDVDTGLHRCMAVVCLQEWGDILRPASRGLSSRP